MLKKIYVGNLSFDTTKDQIRELFAQYGEVLSVNLNTGRYTGKHWSFGFVEMEQSGAEAAIKALDNTKVNGRTLKVKEAWEQH